MEVFHVRYDVSNSKNGKIMLMSGSKEAKKEKSTKKKTIRIRRKHFQTGNHVATNIWHPTC